MLHVLPPCSFCPFCLFAYYSRPFSQACFWVLVTCSRFFLDDSLRSWGRMFGMRGQTPQGSWEAVQGSCAGQLQAVWAVMNRWLPPQPPPPASMPPAKALD